MAKTFKGRPLIPGKLEGEALVSKQPFNTTASYFTNMFAGNTENAPCTAGEPCRRRHKVRVGQCRGATSG